MRTWNTQNGSIIKCICSGRSNVFLVSREDHHILIDTSTKPGYRTIRKTLDSVISDGGKAEALILTHAHMDHAANAAKIKAAYPIKLIAHRDDLPHFTDGTNPEVRGTRPFIRFITDTFEKPLSRMMRYSPVEIDIVMDDRYDLNPLGINGYIIHTPGHTPGSISVIVDDEIALVGDAMFGVSRNSVFPPFALDVKAMVQSWKVLLDTNCSTFLPSHGSENSRGLLEKQYLKYSESQGN